MSTSARPSTKLASADWSNVVHVQRPKVRVHPLVRGDGRRRRWVDRGQEPGLVAIDERARLGVEHRRQRPIRLRPGGGPVLTGAVLTGPRLPNPGCSTDRATRRAAGDPDGGDEGDHDRDRRGWPRPDRGAGAAAADRAGTATGRSGSRPGTDAVRRTMRDTQRTHRVQRAARRTHHRPARPDASSAGTGRTRDGRRRRRVDGGSRRRAARPARERDSRRRRRWPNATATRRRGSPQPQPRWSDGPETDRNEPRGFVSRSRLGHSGRSVAIRRATSAGCSSRSPRSRTSTTRRTSCEPPDRRSVRRARRRPRSRASSSCRTCSRAA